jgi:hypothetical protein
MSVRQLVDQEGVSPQEMDLPPGNMQGIDPNRIPPPSSIMQPMPGGNPMVEFNPNSQDSPEMNFEMEEGSIPLFPPPEEDFFLSFNIDRTGFWEVYEAIKVATEISNQLQREGKPLPTLSNFASITMEHIQRLVTPFRNLLHDVTQKVFRDQQDATASMGLETDQDHKTTVLHVSTSIATHDKVDTMAWPILFLYAFGFIFL